MPWDEPAPSRHVFDQALIARPAEMPRIDTPEGRVYITPDGPCYSVTTILGSTSDKSWLDEWRSRIGDAKADAIVERSCVRGERMHDALEARLLNDPDWLARCDGDVEAEIMAKTIEEGPLRRIRRVLATETRVWHPTEMYAGTLDAMAEVEWPRTVEESIVDYKNARRVKGQEDVFDYCCQIALYAAAVRRTHGVVCRRGIIMMALAEDHLGNKPLVFEVEVADYIGIALDRVRAHRKMYGDAADVVRRHS